MFIHQFLWAVILFVLFIIGYIIIKYLYPLWRFLEPATTAIELYDTMMIFVQKDFNTQHDQIQVKYRRHLLVFSNSFEACLAYADLINQALNAYSKICFSEDDPELRRRKIELEYILKELKIKQDEFITRNEEPKT